VIDCNRYVVERAFSLVFGRVKLAVNGKAERAKDLVYNKMGCVLLCDELKSLFGIVCNCKQRRMRGQKCVVGC
jgi:hypothetical protein